MSAKEGLIIIALLLFNVWIGTVIVDWAGTDLFPEHHQIIIDTTGIRCR